LGYQRTEPCDCVS